MNFEEINKECGRWKQAISKWKCSDNSSTTICDCLKEIKSEIPTIKNIENLIDFLKVIKDV